MSHLTVSEERFHELLAEGTIQPDPPLSDAAVAAMRENRTRIDAARGLTDLDDEPAVEAYRRHGQAALRAHARWRRLRQRVERSPDDREEAARQAAVVREAAVQLFELLEPVLRYHAYWEELPGVPDDGRELEGLRGLGEFVDRPEALPVEDAMTAVRAIRSAGNAVGLCYDRSMTDGRGASVRRRAGTSTTEF